MEHMGREITQTDLENQDVSNSGNTFLSRDNFDQFGRLRREHNFRFTAPELLPSGSVNGAVNSGLLPEDLELVDADQVIPGAPVFVPTASTQTYSSQTYSSQAYNTQQEDDVTRLVILNSDPEIKEIINSIGKKISLIRNEAVKVQDKGIMTRSDVRRKMVADIAMVQYRKKIIESYAGRVSIADLDSSVPEDYAKIRLSVNSARSSATTVSPTYGSPTNSVATSRTSTYEESVEEDSSLLDEIQTAMDNPINTLLILCYTHPDEVIARYKINQIEAGHSI